MERKPQRVKLVPWDPTSEEHYRRMFDQRQACMWRQDEVPNWKEKQLKGIKLLYWILLDDDLKDKERLLASHLARYPGEATPLQDTADAIWRDPRTPTGATFVPVGHVALERDDGSVLTSLNEPPEDILWVKHLYISWAAQAGGLGRSAMDQVEAIAMQDPVNAKVMVLDTMKHEFQASDEWKEAFYTNMGLEIPEPYKTNQEWYERMGYDVVGELSPFPWVNPHDGKQWKFPTIVQAKKLVSTH